MSEVHVEVDREVCQSAGYCVRTAPAVFALGDDAIVAVRDGERLTTGPVAVPGDQAAAVRRASWDCPSAAIIVR
ncbi:ferredoxin [Nocardia terpenica]|uniref:ferredoxin n=1 Tax=Nocardia terpenica TaxID=455432 RepID=UPI0018950A85|nr:ferredoxin [Nocardia terpenica]MBF6061969.1 ferredoxin [Nocardia terpenica]MBF6106231.1 ferredoxin [Nocardia terpenica]MBF6110389.1 ferredoxin [Nocardia terpenica]MBF6120774.1 ferredoxin [Nocardia terpenica]MBF6151725.1 ferredoxin [Nocardia terpenica]